MKSKLNRSQMLKLAKDFSDVYYNLPNYKADKMYKAVMAYDRWFIKDMPEIAYKTLRFKGGVLSPLTPMDDIQALCNLMARKSRDMLLPAITDWTYDYFDDFYRKGIELAQLNGELEGKTIPSNLTKEDKAIIEITITQEIDVWKGHFQKHYRQVERELIGAIQMGKDFDFFLARMTAPDAHIVGFPYGNSRYSWYEHVRRYAIGRPKMVATIAQQRKVK